MLKLLLLLAAAAAGASGSVAALPGERERVRTRAEAERVAEAINARFVRWLEGLGGRAANVRVSSGAYGRSVLAARELAAGEELFFVPADACMTYEAVRLRDPALAAALDRRRPGLDAATALLPGLVRQDMLGEDSYWHPYLATLPREGASLLGTDITDIFLYYAEPALLDRVLAEAPSARASARQMLRDHEGVLSYMLDFCLAEPELFPFPAADLRSALKWAFAMQLSRSWNELDGVGPGFVPLADLANHDGAAPHIETQGDGVRLEAPARTRAGQEVHDSYFNAARCADHALHSFGFVPANQSCLDFRVGLPNGTSVHAQLRARDGAELHEFYAAQRLAAGPASAEPDWLSRAKAIRTVHAGLRRYRDEFAAPELDEAHLEAHGAGMRAMERELWRLRIEEKRTALRGLEVAERDWRALLLHA